MFRERANVSSSFSGIIRTVAEHRYHARNGHILSFYIFKCICFSPLFMLVIIIIVTSKPSRQPKRNVAQIILIKPNIF